MDPPYVEGQTPPFWLISGVFSSDGVVDPDISKLNRVPGAIEAGADRPSNTVINCISGFPASDVSRTTHEFLTTDIPEDFSVFPPTGFEIQIPPGARYIILDTAAYGGQMFWGGWVNATFELDSDGDSFPDSWETDGIDVDGDDEVDLDLPMMGADPLHKDLFVEVDYMGSVANCTRGHKPDDLALGDVKSAFANSPVTNPDGVKGVNLHVLVDEEVPHVDALTVFSGFDSIKLGNFSTADDRNDANKANILEAKKRVYHYCLFIHKQAGGDWSGRGELTGNDFLVSLGATGGAGSRDQQAACFMHELGHNLGLHHGGAENDDVNYKPNYLSIMNYLFLFDGAPVAGRPLDYSRRALPDLNENGLNEMFGIGGLLGDETAFSLPLVNFYGVRIGLADGSQGIDWNGNGTVDGGGLVQANVNNFNVPGYDYASPAGETLKGYNDWANLKFNFRSTTNYADGAHLNVPPEEMTPEIAEAMREATKVSVIPEFPAWVMLPSLITITLLSTVLLKKRKR